MNETTNDLHIVKNLLIEELNFLEQYTAFQKEKINSV